SVPGTAARRDKHGREDQAYGSEREIRGCAVQVAGGDRGLERLGDEEVENEIEDPVEDVQQEGQPVRPRAEEVPADEGVNDGRSQEHGARGWSRNARCRRREWGGGG